MRPSTLQCPGGDHANANTRRPLCNGCWYTLPPAARSALRRRDANADRRIAQLHDQLDQGVPLHKIRIAAL